MPSPLVPRDPDDPMADTRHYAFAHRTIPELFQRHPLGCVGIMESLDEDRLRALWFDIPPRLPVDLARPIGLDYNLLSLGPVGLVAALFTLPRPWFIPGAYHVAVFAADRTGGNEDRGCQIYTLERTSPEGAEEAAVLGNWANGVHSNFGRVPVISRETFLAESVRMVVPGSRALTWSMKRQLSI